MRKMTSATQSFLKLVGWSSMTKAPFRSTTPAITGYSGSPKLKAATKSSRLLARTVW